MDSETGCPADYAELFAEYFPMMKATVSRSGIAHEDVEDVAMDILARFIEKEGIDYYDPHRLHDVGENPDLPGARFRKAKFKGMLRGFTATYVMQYRDKQMVRHRREPWRLEAPRTGGTPQQTGTDWAEDEFYATEPLNDVEVSVSIVQALKQTREILVTSHATDKRDYGAFVDACVKHGLLDGKINRKELRIELAVSSSTLNTMMKELRTILRPLLAEVGVVADVA